jgi:tRNA(adenine34) deaminase
MTPSDFRQEKSAESSSQREQDEHWMVLALAQAELAREHGEVPVGAVLVKDDTALGVAYNCPIATHDTTAHAEILALRQASQNQANYRLPGTTLYVTIEPCTMCVGALIHARIQRLVFGAREPKAGAVLSQQRLLDHESFNHRVSYTEGILADQCALIMQNFFRDKRAEA